MTLPRSGAELPPWQEAVVVYMRHLVHEGERLIL